MEDEAQRLLRQLSGRAARFRPGQLEAIRALVGERRRVLLVQATGWGKSAVYLIATALLRQQGAGPTLLVSPLLALMRNQQLMASRLGVVADRITSDNTHEWDAVEDRLRAGAIDLLLVSPERLSNVRFRKVFTEAIAPRCGLLVIDEIHCVSDWGHDFRPDYRRLGHVVDNLPRGVPLLGATATANDRVVADIQDQFGQGLVTIRGPLDRSSLRLAVVDLPDPADRLAWLAKVVPTLEGSGIVYCLTVDDARRVAEWLTRQGIAAAAYYGAAENDERLRIEDDLLASRVKVVAATSALGMGFDKPDLGFVVHFQSPGSPVAYYQQVGRAGRALASAHGVLLCGTEDADIQDWFIDTAFPARDQAEAVVGLLEQRAAPMSLSQIEAAVNIKRSRLADLLGNLEVDGALEKVDRGWLRTLSPWRYDQDRVDAVTATRRTEQQQMRVYASGGTCLMAFLRAALDDPEAGPCGRCAHCAGSELPREVDVALAGAADGWLRRHARVIAPRLLWPSGLPAVRGRIPEHERVEPGRALTRWGSGGWGPLVRHGKQADRSFDDRLVTASAEAITEWAPRLGLVTWVPSLRHPELVAGFARRLADALGLPSLDLVRKRRETHPQKTRENSAQQVANVLDAFAATPLSEPAAVLLVDDVVDSRWTFTVVGRALRLAGAGAVHPFALADAAGS